MDAHRTEDKVVTTEACDRHRKEINDKLDNLILEGKVLNDRLYKDNGHRSIQSKLNDHERLLRFVIWIAAAVGVAVISNTAIVIRDFIAR